MAHRGHCDNCSLEHLMNPRRVQWKEVYVHRLPAEGKLLCKSCWSKEMAYRRQRNKSLAHKNRLPILKWPG